MAVLAVAAVLLPVTAASGQTAAASLPDPADPAVKLHAEKVAAALASELFWRQHHAAGFNANRGKQPQDEAAVAAAPEPPPAATAAAATAAAATAAAATAAGSVPKPESRQDDGGDGDAISTDKAPGASAAEAAEPPEQTPQTAPQQPEKQLEAQRPEAREQQPQEQVALDAQQLQAQLEEPEPRFSAVSALGQDVAVNGVSVKQLLHTVLDYK